MSNAQGIHRRSIKTMGVQPGQIVVKNKVHETRDELSCSVLL